MSGFWDWAVAAYRRPGAAEACLALQDGRGQNVPLMLWVVWRFRTGAPPGDEALERAAALVRDWELSVVGPLRTVRRTLRSPLDGPPAADQETFRERVKAIELGAERLIMESLEALAGVAAEASPTEAGVLTRAAALYGAPAPPEAFSDLSARL